MSTPAQQARAFIEEIIAVSKRFGFSISHEDEHGGFIIEPYSEDRSTWLQSAQILPAPPAKIGPIPVLKSGRVSPPSPAPNPQVAKIVSPDPEPGSRWVENRKGIPEPGEHYLDAEGEVRLAAYGQIFFKPVSILMRSR